MNKDDAESIDDLNLTRQQKAARTTKRRHGADFYKVIGSQAGKNSTSAPFRDKPGLAAKAGNARWEKYRAMTPEEKEAYREKLRAARAARKAAQKQN